MQKKSEHADNPRFREGPRRPVRWAASLGDGQDQYHCTILNLSLGGAKIQLSDPLEPGTSISLDIPAVSTLEGRLSWQKYGYVGIQFTMHPGEVRSFLGTKADALNLEGAKGKGDDS